MGTGQSAEEEIAPISQLSIFLGGTSTIGRHSVGRNGHLSNLTYKRLRSGRGDYFDLALLVHNADRWRFP